MIGQLSQRSPLEALQKSSQILNELIFFEFRYSLLQ